MKVRYTPRAAADIEDIHAYIAERNPKASIAVVARIRQAIEGLGDFPGMGRMTDREDVRVLPVGVTPISSFTGSARPLTKLWFCTSGTGQDGSRIGP
jgi:plasmid stabilization system protein ParE